MKQTQQLKRSKIMSIKEIQRSIKEIAESMQVMNSYLDDHDEYTGNHLVSVQHAILSHIWLVLNEQQEIIEDLYKRSYKVSSGDAGAMVYNLRDELGLSQSDLAKELGVSTATINRWENNQYGITDKNRIKIQNYIKQQNKGAK
jgi:DNA-binding XRE family transcriptional regulator